jgi:hypothetical protein
MKGSPHFPDRYRDQHLTFLIFFRVFSCAISPWFSIHSICPFTLQNSDAVHF